MAASAARVSTFRFARTGADHPAVGSSSGIIMSVLSSRRYLSMWLRRLSTDRIERRSSERVETLVVVASIKGAQRITALTDRAARLGLKIGMGLACVADLVARPRAAFAARFGKSLLLRLEQALGDADEPITPRLPLPAAVAEQRFPEPIGSEADVLGTIEHLGRQLVPALDRRGEGGRLFQVALFRADGKVHRLEIGTGAPVRDPARIPKLFEERLAG